MMTYHNTWTSKQRKCQRDLDTKLPQTFTGSENTACCSNVEHGPGLPQTPCEIQIQFDAVLLETIHETWDVTFIIHTETLTTELLRTREADSWLMALCARGGCDRCRKRRDIFRLCSWEAELCFNVGGKRSKDIYRWCLISQLPQNTAQWGNMEEPGRTKMQTKAPVNNTEKVDI